MKKILGACFVAALALATTGSPVSAAEPPDYMEGLDCLFGGRIG